MAVALMRAMPPSSWRARRAARPAVGLATVLAAALACGNEGREGSGGSVTAGPVTGGGDGDGTGGSTGGDGTGGATQGDGAGTGATSGDPATAGGGSSGGSDGTRFDVGAGGTGAGDGGSGCGLDGGCACTGVDILFVVDNSRSMEIHQAAIADAFPDFVQAMFDSLPPDTILHVGVTTTEFADYDGSPPAINQDGQCTLGGRGSGLVRDNYVTPDVMDRGLDGVQGKLRTVDGREYYQISTNAGQAERDTFTVWFGQAIVAGSQGANLEFSSGAAAWLGEPANAAHNGGFLRDARTVLAIVFIQDEWDQTPVDGRESLRMVARHKPTCGGTQCIVGGGWFNTDCDAVEGFDNLPNMVDGFADSFVRRLEIGTATPIDGTELTTVLAPIIAKKCDELPPPG